MSSGTEEPPWEGDENDSQADGNDGLTDTAPYTFRRCDFECKIIYQPDAHDYLITATNKYNKWAARAKTKLEGIRRLNGYCVCQYAANFRKFV